MHAMLLSICDCAAEPSAASNGIVGMWQSLCKLVTRGPVAYVLLGLQGRRCPIARFDHQSSACHDPQSSAHLLPTVCHSTTCFVSSSLCQNSIAFDAVVIVNLLCQCTAMLQAPAGQPSDVSARLLRVCDMAAAGGS